MIKDTSTEVYKQIRQSGELGDMQREALDAIYNNQHATNGVTGSELDAFLNSPSAHKRLSELEKMLVIENVGKRRCRITGREVYTWALTGQMPKPLPKEAKQLTVPGTEPEKRYALPAIDTLKTCLPVLRDLYLDLKGKGNPSADAVKLLGQWMAGIVGEPSKTVVAAPKNLPPPVAPPPKPTIWQNALFTDPGKHS